MITDAQFPCPTCGRCPTCGKGGYTPQYPSWIPSEPGYSDLSPQCLPHWTQITTTNTEANIKRKPNDN